VLIELVGAHLTSILALDAHGTTRKKPKYYEA